MWCKNEVNRLFKFISKVISNNRKDTNESTGAGKELLFMIPFDAYG